MYRNSVRYIFRFRFQCGILHMNILLIVYDINIAAKLIVARLYKYQRYNTAS